MSELFVSDLDGTLLQNDATLSRFSRELLIELIADGLPFTIATARNVVSIRQILGELPLDFPVIGSNGAYLSEYSSGRHLKVHHFEGAIASSLFGFFYKKGIIPFIASYNGNNDNLYFSDITNEGMVWYMNDRKSARDKRLRKTDNLKQVLNEMVVCFVTIDRKEALLDLEMELNENYPGQVEVHLYENQYSPGWYWLTVHDKMATKANAIQSLAGDLGISCEKVTVFGDHTNDIKMFQIAGRAIAVENAIPELKKHATHFIGNNIDDSVVKYLKENYRMAKSPSTN